VLKLGFGEVLGVLVVNGIGVSDGFGTLARAGVMVTPTVAAAISERKTVFSFKSSPPAFAQITKKTSCV
jgi:hypothetical protein